jgi:CRISPR-associated endonuclease Cas1
MHRQAIDSLHAWPADAVADRQGTYVATGYGLRIAVWRGRLRICDGIGRDRRDVILHRATSGLRRLVVIGHTGSISLDAIRWLHGIGASYVQLGADAEVLAAFYPGGYEQPRLRRAQARAGGSTEGLALAKWLVTEKLIAQLGVLDELAGHSPVAPDARNAVVAALDAAEAVSDIDALRSIEGRAAAIYWECFAPLRFQLARRDEAQVPTHWRTFGSRRSELGHTPYHATNPANALLNYLYAVLETEATIAAQVVGLDPGLGVYHLDLRFRSSLAQDLMEPVRPAVDRFLLAILTTHTFSRGDFHETREGVCRLIPVLVKELLASTPHWRLTVGAVAEDLARRLLEPADRVVVPRLITGRRGRKGADQSLGRYLFTRRCVICGSVVEDHALRTCSDACENEIRMINANAGAARAKDVLRRLRAEGRDFSRSPETRAKMAASNSSRRLEQAAWDRAHPDRPDTATYWRDVYPIVQRLSAKEIRVATGLSVSTVFLIRTGKKVPHARWWEALEALADAPSKGG